MARHLRVEYPGALYHVTARGNDGRAIFKTDVEREHLLELVCGGMERFEVHLYAYVLMTNHYHLIVRTEHANLHSFMHYINTAFAVWSNLRNNQTGHLFEGPYNAVAMEGEDYLLTATAYVHLNPVRVKAWRDKPAVDRFREMAKYTWSSYGAYTRLHGVWKEPKVSCDSAWGELHAGSEKEGRKRYREYVRAWLKKEEAERGKPESERDPEFSSPFGETRYGCLLGGEAFLEFVHELLERDGNLSEDVVGARTWRKEVPLDRLVSEIATLRGVDSEELNERRHGHAERDLAMYLCRDVGERELRAIGEVFGVKYSAVSYATKRVKQRLRKDRKYRKEVDDARNTLIHLFKP